MTQNKTTQPNNEKTGVDVTPIRHNDYSKDIPEFDFSYDENYYPGDGELPDPQVDPVIPGARIPLTKVGVSGVDLPIQLKRRDGSIQTLHAKTSLYGSLDNPNAKGLNLSRFPILMHEKIADHLTIEGIKDILVALQQKQNSHNVFCKMAFKYPWTQEALRSRQQLPPDAPPEEVYKVFEGVKLSHKKMVGHIFYDCVIEGQLHQNEYKFYLTVNYVYSSCCPCSTTLAHHAMRTRNKGAVGHSQRSIAKITVQFNPDEPVWIEDVVELCRKQVPTETLVICKRVDEQAFAELNFSNLIFVEDAVRLFYQGLDQWYANGKISDFSIVSDHLESLHNWAATSVTVKGIDGGLR